MGYLEPLDDACGVWNFDPGNWRVNRVTFKNKKVRAGSRDGGEVHNPV